MNGGRRDSVTAFFKRASFYFCRADATAGGFPGLEGARPVAAPVGPDVDVYSNPGVSCIACGALLSVREYKAGAF